MSDGRNLRSLRTRADIMAACREYMQAGELAPSVPRVAAKAGRSVRTVFQAYGTTEAMHAAALNEEATRRAVLLHAANFDTRCLDWPTSLQDAVLHAITTGRAIAADTRSA